MTFEWDENKRLTNLAKHKLDFVDARLLFDGGAAITAPSKYPAETRFVTTAMIAGGLLRHMDMARRCLPDHFLQEGARCRRKERIVKHTDVELRAMQEQGASKSDWAAAAARTPPEIEAAIASDPDEAGLELDWTQATVELPQPKAILNMRIDRDILEFFKSEGKGYQTKINAVLRSYVDRMSGQR